LTIKENSHKQVR